MDLLGYILTTVIGALAGALTPILIARFSKTPTERRGEGRSLDAKTETEIAKAAESIAAGSTVTITNLLRDIEYQKQEVAEARAEIDAIVEARRLREIETQKEIEELKARIHKDTEETRQVRNDYANALKKILRQEELLIAAGEYINAMKDAMEKFGIEIPKNGELLDSVYRLKAEREQRGKT